MKATKTQRLGMLLALSQLRWRALMATLDDIQSAVDNTGTKAQEAADRVIASLDSAHSAIDDLTAQVEELKSQGTLDPAKVDRILEGLSRVDSILEGIEAGETSDGNTESGEPSNPQVDNSLPEQQARKTR